MNLRALAEQDLAFTLEDGTYGSATNLMFVSPSGDEYQCSGWVNDIGFGYDTEGVAISTRSVCVVWRLSSLMRDGNYVIPGSKRGWECMYEDMSGQIWHCAITRVEPDRTLGIGRAWIGFDLSDKSNG